MEKRAIKKNLLLSLEGMGLQLRVTYCSSINDEVVAQNDV